MNLEILHDIITTLAQRCTIRQCL